MLATFAISATLVASSLAALLPASPVVSTSNALITPGPNFELFKKQNDIRYLGWVSGAGWSAVSCDAGQMYSENNEAFACCTSGPSCPVMPVACAGGNRIYRYLVTGVSSVSTSTLSVACSDYFTGISSALSICITSLMYENDQKTSPKIGVGCGSENRVWTYFRAQPAAATSKTSTTTITIRSSTSSASASRSSTVAASTSTSTPTPAPPLVEEEKSKSKAWIAGAVVGPLLGLALIGLLAFFFIRRKKKNSHKRQLAPASGSVPAPGVTSFQHEAYPSEMESSQNYHKPQQTAPGDPLGVAKQYNYHPGPHSEHMFDGSQQWQQPNTQPIYEAPSHSPSSSPPNLHPTAASPHNAAQRQFSSELPGN